MCYNTGHGRNKEIRVRFAPSPTGKVHIGNIRAAIYNWLYARHVGGKFLLRVEDTDLERSTPEAIQTLLECMDWLGLNYDEPVFYQTKNVKRHLECVEKLLADGRAYKCERTSSDGKTGTVVMFREQGYLPEALFNYLLLLGWNPGDDREVLTRDEMVKLFTLESVHVTAAKFDIKNLQWMNAEYIKRIPREEFAAELKRRIAAGGYDLSGIGDASFNWGLLVDQLQVRTKFLGDIPGNCAYFFTEDYPFDEKAVEKRLKKDGVKELLLDLADRFEGIGQFSAASCEAMVKDLSQGNGMGPWVHPIRVAVSGRMEGPGLFEMLEFPG